MTNDLMTRETDTTDPALDALLKQHARPVPAMALGALEARILTQATFPLAARRRNARVTVADTLAAWVRVALPMAAAAAIAAAAFMPHAESTATFVESGLRESDPAALLSALESDGGNSLAHHVIASDAIGGAVELESR